MWQFETNDGMSFADFCHSASKELEAAWRGGARSMEVVSGPERWTYMVDFTTMYQRNMRHHMNRMRRVRRVPIVG